MNSSDMRIGNQITVLVPANKYEFNCAWTEEKLLPALELFTCKLLLILEKISPNEISSYFGLNTREIDQLINNLMSNKLISLDSEGLLIGISMILNGFRGRVLKPLKTSIFLLAFFLMS